jgi:hypothetical protein
MRSLSAAVIVAFAALTTTAMADSVTSTRRGSSTNRVPMTGATQKAKPFPCRPVEVTPYGQKSSWVNPCTGQVVR